MKRPDTDIEQANEACQGRSGWDGMALAADQHEADHIREGIFVFYDPQSFPIWLNLALFAISGVFIWHAGTRLARYAEIISDRTELGHALVGVMFLAVATSLPEIASVATSASAGNAPLAVNNLLGGIVLLTAILAVADRVSGAKALTHFVASSVLLLEGLLVLGVLAITLTGFAVGDMHTRVGTGLWPVVIFAVYLVGLYLIRQYQEAESWEPIGEDSDNLENEASDPEVGYEEWSNRRLYLAFIAGSAVILIAGTVIGRTGDALAGQTGLGGSFVGVTLLALATSLSELSTTVSAARIGAYSLAVSNIFGTTVLLPALLLPADIFYRSGPVMDEVGRPAILAAGAGILVTIVYLVGLVERRNRTVAGFGIDSIVVIAIAVAAVVAQYLVR